MKLTFFLLLLLTLSFAAVTTPATELSNLLPSLLDVILPLVIVMVVLSAAAYAAGQFFGVETRAKANAWAQGMLASAAISIAVVFMLYIILPQLLSGTSSLSNFFLDPLALLGSFISLASSSLVAIIIVLVVLSATVYAVGQFTGMETRAKANVWSVGILSGALLVSILYIILFSILPQLGTFFTGTVLGVYTAVGVYGSILIEIAFFISLVILITYLLSKVFKVPEWEAYLNIELSNLFYSFIIVLFVVGLFALGTVISSDFASNFNGGSYCSAGAPCTAMDVTIAHMRSVVADSSLLATIDVYQIQACTSILSTYVKRLGDIVLTQTYKVFPGLDTFVSLTNTLGTILAMLYGTVTAQLTLLYLSNQIMIPLFLPAGLILRFFPPTRDAGAFLISLAFGLQFIYPVSYLISQAAYTQIGAQPYDAAGQRPLLLIQEVCGPIKYAWTGFVFNPTNYGAFPPSLSNAIGGLSTLFSEGFLNAISMTEFVPIIRSIASISLLAIFIPALALFMTLAFINAMTKFIVTKV